MEELNSSGLLEPSAKKKKLDSVIKEDSISSLSEEEEDSDDLLEETLEDFDGPKCCVCQRYVLFSFSSQSIYVFFLSFLDLLLVFFLENLN